jgi:hypothetical protein
MPWRDHEVAQRLQLRNVAAVKRGGLRRALPWFRVAGQLRVLASALDEYLAGRRVATFGPPPHNNAG